MTMQVNVTAPIKLMVAVLVALACIILIVVQLSGTGLGGASMSNALVSTNTSLTNEFPYIATILATGLVFMAMETRRR